MNNLDYIMSKLVIKTKIKKENIEIKNSKVIILSSVISTNYINMFHTDYE